MLSTAASQVNNPKGCWVLFFPRFPPQVPDLWLNGLVQMHRLGLWGGWLVSHGVTWPSWTGEAGRGFLRAQEQVNWRQSRHRVREGGEAEDRRDLAFCHFPLFPHSSCLVFLWQIEHNQAIHTFPSRLSLVNSKNAIRESFQTKSLVGGWRKTFTSN